MPIFVFECANGHRVEFLKLKKSEKEPRRCKQCGEKLERIITGVNWKYTRGKNPLWPQTDPAEDPRPKPENIIPKEPTK